MKLLLLFILLLAGGLIGCKNRQPVERYFYVYYQANELDGSGHPGDIWFNWTGFPTKNQIDSMVYLGLAKKKECCQPLLISYFFEFKSKNDFDVFGSNYKGNLTPTKDKLDCCVFCPDSISFGGMLNADTSGNISPAYIRAIQGMSSN